MSKRGGVPNATARPKESPSPPRTNKDPNALIEYSDLLLWQRDNEFIHTGYRQATHSFYRSIISIPRIHNETVNIWSHGLGSIAFLVTPLFMYWSISSRYQYATSTDLFALFTFFASVTVCFLFSSSFHIFLNHSPRIWYVTSQLDHLGIVLVIWGSTVPSAHFGHYCDPKLQWFYWKLATLCALLCGHATFHPMFRTPAGRKIRVLLYMLLGLSSFFPAIHGVKMNGYAEHDRLMGLSYFIGLGILNGTGAGIYGARIPERWYPKRFDIIGSSHQVMHVLVICGAWCYSVGLLRAFDYWHGLNGDGKGACRSSGLH
ncbi:HlyIII-domain-containing protein [Zopfia rhizophila CBS 207.26]|uniref:HlyIII-domain-containing protein n=1 Tax=Zopfia rhizophila CBS 207.26 TaxID=1314779 RepID=A0A6A6EE44_9PEZI|nr:HlyIII-domain-containing protein [Zopfia rhizophila CBS 207.26]